jgi:predicted secreted protein
MPATALQHFTEDIARARAIVTHADPLPHATPSEKLLRSDLLRSAWMFAIGSLDAYFCDAYTDIIAATASSKSRQAAIELPEWVYEVKFPLRAILEEYDNENWRWRMAARKMMERENVISLAAVQTLFNKFFRKGHRFFRDQLDAWMTRPDAKIRLFGVLPADYSAKTPQDKQTARETAIDQFEERFRSIFQRRHDCIHNCDRPRMSPQPLDKGGTVLKVIQDIEFLVNRCNEHINTEFREFLVGVGCPAATITQAGY